ncbi:MAG: hypothetical protein GXY44_06945 [Phycisphaerales bacterium]|nr:hypothetical protein [Phycisphaerales bacterium]
MIRLNPSLLAPEIATQLMLRGTELPPLEWHRSANRAIKLKLESLDDARLFAPAAVQDAAMVAAIRSLLYLWSGGVGEAGTCAQSAPEQERNYLVALGERLQGVPDKAKASFQKLNAHPVYERLVPLAMEEMKPVNDSRLQRVRQILEMDERWEPFVFIDLFEQARAGKLSRPAEEVVRRIQVLEFELLFAHCYLKAIGDSSLDLFHKPAAPEPTVVKRKKPVESHRRHSLPPSSAKPTDDQPKPEPAAKASARPEKITVSCPRCSVKSMIPASNRGAKCKCYKCGHLFVVGGGLMPIGKSGSPQDAAASPAKAARGPTDEVRVSCPKCAQAFSLPASARGKKAKCARCAALFMVPEKSSPALAR